MAITKQSVILSKTIVINEIIQVLEDIQILENGKIISSTFHRYTVVPGQDLIGLPQEVIDLAIFLHTPAVIATYQTFQQNSLNVLV